MWGLSNRNTESATRVAALGALRTNVMIADPDFNITYMNPAADGLMREAEPELKRELPRFNASALIGSNIDIFHKNPAHQRKMLSVLDKPHNATIHVGSRTFDLLVTPLKEKGQRTGFVVEWADARNRLQNLDYAAQFGAFSRTEAIIEFAPDGTILTANPNFLKTMGYALDEIRGKHHGIFVAPDYRTSREYHDFWDRIGRGEPQHGQFRRFDRNQKEIWIEGTYSPIVDAGGKITKVIKFAKNVTDQVNLLGNLKTLIDKNFTEIDGAIGQSTSEARSASMAAGETSSNVQSVAASAEELAASIAEISQSMSKSRVATENAFEQIVWWARTPKPWPMQRRP